MDTTALLLEAMSRAPEACRAAVEGIDAGILNRRPEVDGRSNNSISWLVWHTGREIDVQVAALRNREEAWTRDGWADRFALDLPADSMGYGHSAEEAAKVVVDDPDLLLGYLDAAVADFEEAVRETAPEDLDRVVDDEWDPPVTLGIRLLSVVDDAAQHTGQAAYVRGLLAG